MRVFFSFNLCNVQNNCQTVTLNFLCFPLSLLSHQQRPVGISSFSLQATKTHDKCYHFKRQIMLHVRHKSKFTFTITSTDGLICLWACEIGHKCLPMQGWLLRQRGKGQYVYKSGWVRADLPLCICESVCIWLLAPVWLQKVRVYVTTAKWACPPQREKMRENWRTKREAGVRGAAECRQYKCGYEKTHI